MYTFQSPQSLEVCIRSGTAGQVCKLTWLSTWLSPGSRLKSITILWKYGTGQPVHPHWSESTMARRHRSSSSARATICTCSSPPTAAGLMLASSSTMRVSGPWLAPRAGHCVPGDRCSYICLQVGWQMGWFPEQSVCQVISRGLLQGVLEDGKLLFVP